MRFHNICDKPGSKFCFKDDLDLGINISYMVMAASPLLSYNIAIVDLLNGKISGFSFGETEILDKKVVEIVDWSKMSNR